MARASVVVRGLKEWQRDLERLTPALKLEAAGIVQRAAEATRDLARPKYPRSDRDTKNHLQDGAYAFPFAPLTWIATNVAPHALIYEFGTVTRTTRRTGANRGRMPARPVIIPTAIRQRALMVSQLKALVRDAGFQVSEIEG